MKVTKTSTQLTFQPIELKITIESEEEYAAIKGMVSCYIGCPQAMVEGEQLDEEHQAPIESLFYQLNECL